jgi:F0F1-type ATP synthase assembly protein I
MIKLFDGDDDREQTGKGKTPASPSLSIVPEADPIPVETPAVEEVVSYTGVEGPFSDRSPEPPLDDPALRPVENIVEKIQEEPAALRWDESPGTEQEIPPQHAYEPEHPDPLPEAGPREYPPGFSENESKPDVFVKEPYEPQSKADAIRGAGLAWSAGIIFFGSIVFMLILGWGADLLLGSAPWGIVGGIVLGSLIGFIQFFRISSQIFKK